MSNGFRLTDFGFETDPHDLRPALKSAAVSLVRRGDPEGYVPAPSTPPKPLPKAPSPQVPPAVRMQEFAPDEPPPAPRAQAGAMMKSVLSSQHMGKVALACGFALAIFMLIMIIHLSNRVSELHRTVTLLMLVRR